MINKIYPTVKQMVLFMLAQKELGFKKVVLVEYPSKGLWSLGFITNEQLNKVNQALGAEAIAVFVPTPKSADRGFNICQQSQH